MPLPTSIHSRHMAEVFSLLM